tara:strand:+ start:382 stop:582 length:201 start_codon:yes stop_codon:yes gene_type:complete
MQDDLYDDLMEILTDYLTEEEASYCASRMVGLVRIDVMSDNDNMPHYEVTLEPDLQLVVDNEDYTS